MPYKKGGSGLNMVVQSLPPGQFTVVDTKDVLNKLMCIQEGAVQKYGPGNFRWVCTVGDLVQCMMRWIIFWHVTKLRLQVLAFLSGQAGGCVNG